mgnify:FL=1
MCPMTTTIMAETCSICAGSTRIWVVDKNQDDTEVQKEPSSWGEIIYDKGQGTFEDKEDPFNPDNW